MTLGSGQPCAGFRGTMHRVVPNQTHRRASVLVATESSKPKAGPSASCLRAGEESSGLTTSDSNHSFVSPVRCEGDRGETGEARWLLPREDDMRGRGVSDDILNEQQRADADASLLASQRPAAPKGR
jgi:hypothetical protein